MSSRELPLVTPTFGGDRDRVVLLRRTLNLVDCQWPHYVVVQTEDREAFRELRGDRNVTLLTTADVLTPSMERFRLLCRTNRSVGDLAARIIRRRLTGWFSQQIVKLTAGRALGLDSWVCVDSDCAFLRPPRAADFRLDGGSTAIFEFLDFPVGESILRFHRQALAFLRLPTDVDSFPKPRRTYVQQLIPLRADVVEAQIAWIEEHYRGPWWAAMARARATEYTTYGLFARHLSRMPAVATVDRRLVRLFYTFDDETFADEVRRRFAKDADLRAVMVHSAMGVDPHRYEELVVDLAGNV